MSKLTVCIIGPGLEEKGGIATASRYLALIYKKLGCKVVWLVPRNINFKFLESCQLIHVQGPLRLFDSLKLIMLKNARKILTLHGWVLDEARVSVFTSYGVREKLKSLLVYVQITINWIIHRFILIPYVYDYVTAVSYTTAKKNSVRALVIPNPIICKNVNFLESYSKFFPNEMIFITYVSIGGGKMLAVPRFVRLINLLNKRLEDVGINKHVILHIYGKDVPSSIIASISKIQYVKFMGYVNDYSKRLKEAALFLAGYTFPELGYAVLEAMCMGVPVAKFTENPELEEIIDGFNGILALSDEEMIKKLVKYILDMDKMRRKLAVNAKNTIVKKRDPTYIAVMWKTIMKALVHKEKSMLMMHNHKYT
jgi:glycosyltransferase involved in cell wall biosynthesis